MKVIQNGTQNNFHPMSFCVESCLKGFMLIHSTFKDIKYYVLQIKIEIVCNIFLFPSASNVCMVTRDVLRVQKGINKGPSPLQPQLVFIHLNNTTHTILIIALIYPTIYIWCLQFFGLSLLLIKSPVYHECLFYVSYLC